MEIDTSNQHQIIVRLIGDSGVVDEISDENQFGSQVLLPAIVKLLGRNGVGDVGEVGVVTGPGSFTGLRVGVSVANAIGFALGVPVNGKTMETELSYT